MAKAKQMGVGSVYIIDETNLRLKLYEVIQDSPSLLLASRKPVDPHLTSMFMAIVDAKRSSRLSVVVEVDVDDPLLDDLLFRDNPLEGFENLNAYDFARSSSLRNELGAAMAVQTTIPGGNSLARLLFSSLLTAPSVLGGNASITYVITWRDGTKTTMVMTADTVHSPEMALGESRDADNNTIPDQSVITNPETYVGEFQFSSNSSMQEWLDGMRMMGTPVTGPGGEQQQELRIFCRWVGDGTEFRCGYF